MSRAKCALCGFNRWARIVAGRGLCVECINRREDKKARAKLKPRKRKRHNRESVPAPEW